MSRTLVKHEPTTFNGRALSDEDEYVFADQVPVRKLVTGLDNLTGGYFVQVYIKGLEHPVVDITGQSNSECLSTLQTYGVDRFDPWTRQVDDAIASGLDLPDEWAKRGGD